MCAIGAAISLRENSPTTAAYLMKTHSLAAWNKSSRLWLSPVSRNLVSSKGIEREQGDDDVNRGHVLVRSVDQDSCASS